MKENKFTVDYFIKKFEAIPEDEWAVQHLETPDGARCAMGHCGGHVNQSKESASLAKLLSNLTGASPDRDISIYAINDGLDTIRLGYHFENKYTSKKIKGAKQRILAALYDIKKMQEPIEQGEVKETIRYVTVEVDKEVKKLTKQQILN